MARRTTTYFHRNITLRSRCDVLASVTCRYPGFKSCLIQRRPQFRVYRPVHGLHTRGHQQTLRGNWTPSGAGLHSATRARQNIPGMSQGRGFCAWLVCACESTCKGCSVCTMQVRPPHLTQGCMPDFCMRMLLLLCRKRCPCLCLRAT